MTLQHLNYPDHSNGQLTDAHGYLLSFAAVQRQLASSSSDLPDQREGKITVAFSSAGKDWTLSFTDSVTDNGVAMPADPADATPDLGTIIVESIANHLEAEVQGNSARPGTAVSIVHYHLAVVPIGKAA